MSTSKDGHKETTSSKKTSSKREGSKDRYNIKTKKEPKVSEENDKSRKSRTSTKVSSKPEKISSTSTTISSKPLVKEVVSSSTKLSSKLSENELAASSRKVSSKLSQKELSTSSRKILSKPEKENPTNSTKTSLKPEKMRSKKVSSKTETVSSTTISKTVSRHSQDEMESTNINKTSSKRSSSKREVPSAPYKENIKKTQYFPSKNLYSNALKHTDIPENLSEKVKSSIQQDKKPSRKSIREEKDKNTSSSKVIKANHVDSPRSVRSITANLKQEASPDTDGKSVKAKFIKNVTTRDPSPDTSSVSERPRTATLRKGSIVNANIVGPEVPKHVKEVAIKEKILVQEQQPPTIVIKQKSPTPTNSDDNYDDDFESYDSDFEVYSSSEDNSNLANISGEETSSVSSSNEDIPENKESSPTYTQSDRKVSSSTIDDEKAQDSGTFELPDFKHRRILENIKESVEQEHATLNEERLKEKANLSSFSDEGFEDQQSLQFINFADARKKCQKKRLNELRRKRGEEILSMIKLDNINFTIFDLPAVHYDVFISNYGHHDRVQASSQTGDDDISEEVQTEAIEVQTKWTQMPNEFSSFDQNQEIFWINYKKEYLGVGCDNLADNSLNHHVHNINEKHLKHFLNQAVDLISDVLAEANIGNLDKFNKNEGDIPFSDGYLQFNTETDIFQNTRVQNVSVFPKNINHILTVHIRNDNAKDLIKSIVSVWDISDFAAPRTALVSYGEICCASFALDVPDFIFAGQNDGAILIWNIKEKCKIYDISSRAPTVTTDIGSSHFSKVVGIQPIKENHVKRSYFDNPENNEICSLDEDGVIKIWNIFTNSDLKNSPSDIVLMNTTTIKLQDLYPEISDLLCSDFILLDKHIYVTTNYGYILHCILNMNARNIKKFVPATPIDATCLERCPFSSSHFLAGYSNGNITLYSRNTERPLMVLKNNEEIFNTSVQIIQWSKTRPFVLFAKDSRNTIHIWDLSKSDMYPEYSIPFQKNIVCLKLSPAINIEKEDTSYMLIGTEDGKVYLHLLNKDYGQESYEVYKEHVATFLNYVSRL